MCHSNCRFLTCIQVYHKIGKVVWYFHLFTNFPVCCDSHSQRWKWSRNGRFSGIPLLSLWSSRHGNLIFGSSAFYKFSLYTWKFSIRILLKPSLKDFEHNLTSMRNEQNCKMLCIFFFIIWRWNVSFQISNDTYLVKDVESKETKCSGRFIMLSHKYSNSSHQITHVRVPDAHWGQTILKYCSLQQRKVYYRNMQGDGRLMP